MKKISDVINSLKNKKISEIKLTLQQKKIVAGGLAAAVVVVAAVFGMTGSSSKDSGKEAVNPTTTEATPLPFLSTDGTGLQKNVNENIDKLVNDYLTACKEGNIEALEKLVSNGDEMTKEQVQKPYEYVEKIQNVDCYTIDGPDEGTYIVYVYVELKFVDIDTAAPGLMQFYVSKASDDSLVIMLDQLDEHVEAARAEALKRDDVKQLISMVETKYAEAVNKDEKLKAFNEKMKEPVKEKAPATEQAQQQEQQQPADQAQQPEQQQAEQPQADQAQQPEQQAEQPQADQAQQPEQQQAEQPQAEQQQPEQQPEQQQAAQ